MWNSLPSEIVCPESLNSFENNLGNNLQDLLLYSIIVNFLTSF